MCNGKTLVLNSVWEFVSVSGIPLKLSECVCFFSFCPTED